MFDAIFSSMKAWNSVWMLFGGLLLSGIGVLLIWDFISVRIYRRRVYGRIVGVRVTGARTLAVDENEVPVQEESEQTTGAGGKPQESYAEQFRRSPFSTFFASLFVLLIICVPVSFLVFGAWQSYDVLTLRATGVLAPAVVVDIESRSDDGSTTYTPVLAFKDLHGKRWKLADRLSTARKKFRRGDKTAVYYDPENPKRFIMNNLRRYMLFNLIFMATPFALYGLLRYSASRNKKAAAGRNKKNFTSEMYRPVFEFENLQGESVQADGDSSGNWISDKIPGSGVRLLVDDDDLDTVRRPGRIGLVIGLVFAAPGQLLIYGAVAHFEFNLYSALIGLGVLGYGAYKLSGIIKPRSEWETKDAFRSRMRKERVKKHRGGRLLTDREIRERVKYHDRNALLWSPLVAVIALGFLIGGWYLYLALQGFTGKALAAEGEVVRLESRRSAGSDSGPSYYPVVSFIAESGKEVLFTDRIGMNPPLYQSGESVNVLYDPGHPDKAMIDRGLFNCLPALALFGAGGLMGWWLIAILAGVLRRRKYLNEAGLLVSFVCNL
ncbi:MAG: DUF3592 domain-containing protein [Proteobacteria bacterium]|nr:DUF3592 domain-containing protein [Pseudomonadota bacterium]MBU1737414.1 DUF3592 domain-containing protein [Pseudomonadota bacterium]